MRAERDGVGLFYTESGRGEPAVLMTHCLGGSSAFMAPVFQDLQHNYRVVSIDARGHGQSDRQLGDYSMSTMADDLIWLADELDLGPAVLVGHSMGGNVLLEMAARSPRSTAGIVILDASTVPVDGLIDQFRPVLNGLRTDGWRDVLQGFMSQLVGHENDHEKREALLSSFQDNDQDVLVGALASVLDQDSDALAARVEAPVLYISAGPWHTDVARFRSHCPQLLTAQVVGSGHNLQLEVPAQVNAMIRRFIEVAI